jgi:hypothetical protein
VVHTDSHGFEIVSFVKYLDMNPSGVRNAVCDVESLFRYNRRTRPIDVDFIRNHVSPQNALKATTLCLRNALKDEETVIGTSSNDKTSGVRERKRENLLIPVEESIEREQGAEFLLNPDPLTPKPIKLSLS